MRQGGDGEAFRSAAVACLDGLYRFALSLCRDPTLSEDLVQETFVRALKAARVPDPGDGVRPWLFTILHNVWRNERRRVAPVSLEEHGADLASPTRDPGDAVDLRDRAARLRADIEALPDAYREVVLLRFGEGFSYQQIAEIVACPAGTVMSRLARARALLRRCPEAGAGGRP